ncbi:recombinase family protein [Tepidibacter sp. Z1-5]|uniref:recombinase family protein n=1 Tax=Tepidibacter sp. Z1-5 TaxID=3134138 RepID=UPI004040B75B
MAPYGYDVENKYLKINEKEAKIVQLIYRLYYNEGCGIGKIARYLNDKEIPTKKGIKWSRAQISRILENKKYI